MKKATTNNYKVSVYFHKTHWLWGIQDEYVDEIRVLATSEKNARAQVECMLELLSRKKLLSGFVYEVYAAWRVV